MNHNRAGVRDLKAYTITTGAIVEPDENTGMVTLTATTFYIELGSQNAGVLGQTEIIGVHLKWNAAFAGVISFESSNFPAKKRGYDTGPDDVTPFSVVAGDWIPEDPVGAEIEVVGTGNSATGAVITAGGTNAGGAYAHISGMGSRRMRLKVVCSTGGTLRAQVNGKAGA